LARQEQVAARLGHLLEDAGIGPSGCPEGAWTLLVSARERPAFVRLRALWEVRRVLKATEQLRTELILLKGAAYLATQLPVARGRFLSDVDVLVRRDQLDAVEQALLAQGWEHQELNPYDQRYYREWMHEIPPMRHRDRGMEVDIHHTILPLTSRLNPDPELLWEASIPLDEPGLRVLSPADMILHSATHLLQDGEVKGGFKDLLDLHQLFQHFGGQAGFWDGLPLRARKLGLQRPLFYALHLCVGLFRTPIPPDLLTQVREDAPRPFGGRLVTRLMQRVLRPKPPEGRGTPVSDWLLYVRSHWLRMPPLLLASHLSRKALRRLPGRDRGEHPMEPPRRQG
jgi:hypothetical protein